MSSASLEHGWSTLNSWDIGERKKDRDIFLCRIKINYKQILIDIFVSSKILFYYLLYFDRQVKRISQLRLLLVLFICNTVSYATFII